MSEEREEIREQIYLGNEVAFDNIWDFECVDVEELIINLRKLKLAAEAKGYHEVGFDIEQDYDEVHVKTCGTRFETDAEMQKRLKKQRKAAERRAAKAAEKAGKEQAVREAEIAKLRELASKYPDVIPRWNGKT